MMLARLSIREWLIAAFSCLLLVTAGMGSFSILRMQAVNEASVEINAYWMPSILSLSRITNRVREVRIALLSHIASDSAEMKQQSETRIETLKTELAAAKRDYERVITSSEERQLFVASNQAIEAYLQAIPSVLTLSRENRGAEARALQQASLLPLAATVMQGLDALVTLNTDGSRDAGKTADAIFVQSRVLILSAIGFSLLLGLGIGLFILRAIGRGIADIVAPMQQIAEGDLSASIPQIPERTEMGRIAATLRIFKSALEEKQLGDAAIRQEEAAKAQRSRLVADLVSGFEAEVAEGLSAVASATTQLDAMAGSMTINAGEGVSRAASVAAAAEQASASVQNVAAAAEELGASIAEIARRVTESATAARNAADGARASDTAITGLSESAQRIGDVVRLINDIAGQTNLLALNATIEAARAGEHGKGFAVVASEVKALAAQTAKATEQIGAQIATMQAETRGAVDAIRSIAATIDQVDHITVQVAAAAEEQASATQEIARAVAEAATGTREVSRYTGELSQGAAATGEAASQVRGSSAEVTQRSQRLRQQVDGFLAGIRAA